MKKSKRKSSAESESQNILNLPFGKVLGPLEEAKKKAKELYGVDIDEDGTPHPLKEILSKRTEKNSIQYIMTEWEKKKEEDIIKDEEEKSGAPIRTSNSLLSNIGRTETAIQLSLNLFPEEDPTLLTQETTYTPNETSLIYALLPKLSDSIESIPSLKSYTQKLGGNIEERKYNNSAPLPGRVPIIYDITELARLRYGIPKGQKVDNIYKKRLLSTDNKGRRGGELFELSRITKTFTIKGNGKEVVLRAPLINLGMDASVIDQNGIVKKRAIEVYFEDVFLFDILEKYALLPRNYPALRAQYSNDTEVFRTIEAYLLQWRGDRVKKYNTAREDLLKRTKKENLSEEEEAAQEKELRTFLDIDLSEIRISQTLTSSTYYKDTKRKKYLNKKKLRNDIEKAAESLKKIGLITGWRTGKTSSGGTKYIFSFNEKWLKESKNLTF